MPSSFGVVDLFAGPGGLGEGFSPLRTSGSSPFSIGISVEKEAAAHRTLRLRAFLREYVKERGRLPQQFVDFHSGEIDEPDWSTVDAQAWKLASTETRMLELGRAETAEAIDTAINAISKRHDDTVLIGGPPCQAYSLVGRARSRGTRGYRPEADERHYLFREYIRVLDRLRPAAFIMENVKGMLSSTVESRLVFEMLMEDLSSLGSGHGHLYELRAVQLWTDGLRLRRVTKPSDFIVRAEDLGVPQRRHRVIIIGIRSDLVSRADRAVVPNGRQPSRSLEDAIGSLEPLRSGLSTRPDTEERWTEIVTAAAASLEQLCAAEGRIDMAREFGDVVVALKYGWRGKLRSSRALPADYGSANDDLMQWLENPELRALAQHGTRTHMDSDLKRYLFAAVHARIGGVSPKARAFPQVLAPEHVSWATGKFADRFRVQVAGEPSTTVTSHISKDGHYFIHPDPMQCRSLTVREAARLQTFPDDYLFLGNRTQQYVQVGNAVPPYLARQIAQILMQALEKAEAPSTPGCAPELVNA